MKKLYKFNGIFYNSYIEVLFIIFNFFIICFSVNFLKNHLLFTFEINKLEKFPINNKFCLIKKEILKNENILLNRMIVLNYVIFYFRTCIMQNFSKNIFSILILILSFLFSIGYFIFGMWRKTKIRFIFFFSIFKEILFLIYMIITFLNFFPMIFLDVFYILTYFFDIFNTFLTVFIIYNLNKRKKKNKNKTKNELNTKFKNKIHSENRNNFKIKKAFMKYPKNNFIINTEINSQNDFQYQKSQSKNNCEKNLINSDDIEIKNKKKNDNWIHQNKKKENLYKEKKIKNNKKEKLYKIQTEEFSINEKKKT